MSKTVLGVKIDDVSAYNALEKVSSWLEKKTLPKIIVTPGPEFILTAQKDQEFKRILNAADLSLPDGFGLNLYTRIKNRVPGTNFMLELCKLSVNNKSTIGLIGGQEGVAKMAAKNLAKKFPGIKVLVAIDGEEATQILNDYDIDNYIKQPIDILFLAFGHPKQEKLIWKLKIAHCPFRVGMGVGGAFDYISGQAWRPNKFLRSLGLEWLGRLISQPSRFGRIFKATIVFPIMLFLKRG